MRTCPESVGQVVAKCIAKAPAQRPGSALELRDWLRRELELWVNGNEELVRGVGAIFRERLPLTPRRKITYLTPPEPRGMAPLAGASPAADPTPPATAVTSPLTDGRTSGMNRMQRLAAVGRGARNTAWAMAVLAILVAVYLGYSVSRPLQTAARTNMEARRSVSAHSDSALLIAARSTSPTQTLSTNGAIPSCSATPSRSAPEQADSMPSTHAFERDGQ